jgi:hypothetical protein
MAGSPPAARVKSGLQHSPGVLRFVRMRAPRADADFSLVLVSP